MINKRPIGTVSECKKYVAGNAAVALAAVAIRFACAVGASPMSKRVPDDLLLLSENHYTKGLCPDCAALADYAPHLTAYPNWLAYSL